MYINVEEKYISLIQFPSKHNCGLQIHSFDGSPTETAKSSAINIPLQGVQFLKPWGTLNRHDCSRSIDAGFWLPQKGLFSVLNNMWSSCKRYIIKQFCRLKTQFDTWVPVHFSTGIDARKKDSHQKHIKNSKGLSTYCFISIHISMSFLGGSTEMSQQFWLM